MSREALRRPDAREVGEIGEVGMVRRAEESLVQLAGSMWWRLVGRVDANGWLGDQSQTGPT